MKITLPNKSSVHGIKFRDTPVIGDEPHEICFIFGEIAPTFWRSFALIRSGAENERREAYRMIAYALFQDETTGIISRMGESAFFLALDQYILWRILPFMNACAEMKAICYKYSAYAPGSLRQSFKRAKLIAKYRFLLSKVEKYR